MKFTLERWTVTVEDDLDESFCNFYDEDDCRFAFVYSFDDKGKVIIKAQQERECPPQVYVLGMYFGYRLPLSFILFLFNILYYIR